jgi:DNA-binding NarL/FixJ family response regulator
MTVLAKLNTVPHTDGKYPMPPPPQVDPAALATDGGARPPLRAMVYGTPCLWREGIKAALDTLDDGAFGACEGERPADIAQRIEDGERVDLILFSLVSLDSSEFSRLGELRTAYPAIPVVLYSPNDNRERLDQFLRTGVRGYVPVSLSSEVMARALRLVAAGGTYAPIAVFGESCTEITRRTAPKEPRNEPPLAALRHLTRRQHQVLAHLAKGRTNRLIARALGLRESTVKAHVKQIMRKLGVANRTQAALLAIHRTPATDPR